MASETNHGIYQEKQDDGSYVQEDFGLGFLVLQPDGKTLKNLVTGDSYDLSQIGGGGSGSAVTTSHDGTTLVSDTEGIDYGSRLTASDDGDNTITVAVDDEAIQDLVASLLSGGDKISVPYNDSGDTLTVDTSALDAEEVRDEVASFIGGGNGIDTSHDDPNNALTLSIPQDAIGSDELNTGAVVTWTSEHSFDGGITGLPSPSDPQDAARKKYVDAIKQGLAYKDPVVAATDGTSIDLSSSTDANPVDGVTLSDGDRVLLKDQTDASENGIYEAVFHDDPSSWIRTSDADEDDEVTSGMYVFVEEGTANQNSAYVLETDDPITVGSTALNFTIFGRAGEIVAGDYLSKSGSTMNVEPQQIPVGELGDVQWTAMLKGTDANKPSAGTADRFYFATDTQLFYRDNGTSWVAVGGVGTSSNPLPEQHVQSLSADGLSIDGQVVSASNYADLQSALDAAPEDAIILATGDYSGEDVTISTSGQTLLGTGEHVASNVAEINSVTITGTSAKVWNVQLNPDSGDALSVTANRAEVMSCRVDGPVTLDGADIRYHDNHHRGTNITLASNSLRCTVHGNTNVGTITDNGGSNNTTGGNT